MNSFLSGVQAGNQTLQVRQSIKDSDRRERQRELNNRVKGYEKNEDGAYAPNDIGLANEATAQTEAENRLVHAEAKAKQLEDITSEMSMTKMIISMADGSVADAQMELNKNPNLKAKLESTGMRNLSQVDWDRDGELWEADPNFELSKSDLEDKELRNTLDKAYFKVQRDDGKWQLVPTKAVYDQSGTKNYIPSKERDRMNKLFNTIGEVLGGRIITTEEERFQKAKLDTATQQLGNDKRIAELQREEMESYLGANPNATLNDYINSQKVVTAPSTKELINREKLKQLKAKGVNDANKEKEEAISYSPAIRAEFDAKRKVGGFTKEDIAFAEKLNETLPKNYQPLKGEPLKKYNRVLGLAKTSNAIVDKMAKADWDADAVESVSNVITNIFSSDNPTMGDANKKLKGIQIGTEVRSVLADYINYVSGAGVTDQERQSILNIFGVSAVNDKEALVNGMKTFSNIMRDRSQVSIDSLENPLDIINHWDDLKGINKHEIGQVTKGTTAKPTKVSATANTKEVSAGLDAFGGNY